MMHNEEVQQHCWLARHTCWTVDWVASGFAAIIPVCRCGEKLDLDWEPGSNFRTGQDIAQRHTCGMYQPQWDAGVNQPENRPLETIVNVQLAAAMRGPRSSAPGPLPVLEGRGHEGVRLNVHSSIRIAPGQFKPSVVNTSTWRMLDRMCSPPAGHVVG